MDSFGYVMVCVCVAYLAHFTEESYEHAHGHQSSFVVPPADQKLSANCNTSGGPECMELNVK